VTTAASAKRRPGRPKGTGYTAMDANLHAMMRLAIAGGKARSIAEAARQVIHLAFGAGTLESKLKRIVRAYPY
jgi:hypothetical protein